MKLRMLVVVAALAECNTTSFTSGDYPPDVITLGNWKSFLQTDGCVKPPLRGGNHRATLLLVHEMNKHGRCLEVTERAYSAAPIMAAMIEDVRVPDRNAKLFLFHYADVLSYGSLHVSTNVIHYAHAGLLHCFAYHHERAKGDMSAWTALSLNQVKADCL